MTELTLLNPAATPTDLPDTVKKNKNKKLLKIQAVTGSKWMYFFKQSVIWPTKNLIMRTRFHFSNDPTY